jgi:RNA polymerase sigma-70 factor, ECF subfamily
MPVFQQPPMTAPTDLARQEPALVEVGVDRRTEEAALVTQAKESPDAFGELYERYVNKIYNYIYYRTGSAADAEDLTARVFMRALQNIDGYEDRGYAFSAWLYRIAHNLVANWHRDNSRRPTIGIDDLAQWHVSGKGPEDMTALLEDRAALLEAIERLPTDRRELLLLKFVDQLSNAEIGDVMGRSEGAVKSLYHRTLQSLRQELVAPAPRRSWRALWRRGLENGT